MDQQRGIAIIESSSQVNQTNKVICLHGMWMVGNELFFVKRGLENDHGFQCELFSYPSVRETLDENARRLADFVQQQDDAAVHLLGHSLGGVLALRMLARYPEISVDRVICLGSPLSGSHAASILQSHDLGKVLLGKSIVDGVVIEPAIDWACDVARNHDIGIIAGTVPIGIGRIIADFDGENDGTVSVAETHLDGAKDHICMSVNHTGLVLSRSVINQAAAFLRHGKFAIER